MTATPTLTIPEARIQLSPQDFRAALRRTLLNNPSVKLKHVAAQLGVSRQCVNQIVGKLNRPNCAHPDRPAPRKEEAKKLLPQLIQKVKAGEPAERAAAELGISLAQAHRLGFRSRATRPPHGTIQRSSEGCNCWRCRKAQGIALPRGPLTGTAKRAQILDWLAWADPDTNQPLTQAAIGKLAGVAQTAVSRIYRQERGL
jgi:predicted transcriptional regulator